MKGVIVKDLTWQRHKKVLRPGGEGNAFPGAIILVDLAEAEIVNEGNEVILIKARDKGGIG